MLSNVRVNRSKIISGVLRSHGYVLFAWAEMRLKPKSPGEGPKTQFPPDEVREYVREMTPEAFDCFT